MDKELYINGELVDLGEDTVIALTKQANNVANQQTSYGDLTNEFTLPFTERNNLILGVTRRIESGSSIPYTKLSVRYIDSGVEIIPNGYAVYESVTDGYKTVIYSNNSDFFSDLSNKILSDLNYSALNHAWSTANIAATRANTDNYKYSLIDYGQMDPAGFEFRSDQLFPSFFTKDIVGRIVSEAGWTIEGFGLDEERYQKLKLDWSNDAWQRPQSELDMYAVASRSDTIQSFNYINGSEAGIPALYFPYQLVALDNGAYTSGVYTVPHRVRIRSSVKIGLDYSFAGNQSGLSGLIILQLYNITTSTIIDEWVIFTITDITIQPSGSYGQGSNLNNDPFVEENGILSLPFEMLEEGHEIEWRLAVSAEFDLDIDVTNFQINFDAYKDIRQGEYYVLANQLPPISQIEFMKAIFTLFSGVINSQSSNKTVIVNSYAELDTSNALDVSDMYVENPSGDPIEFHPEGVYQLNRFSWSPDDNIPYRLGDSTFAIQDETLEIEGEFVNMIFGASEMVKRFSGSERDVPLHKKIAGYEDDFIELTGHLDVGGDDISVTVPGGLSIDASPPRLTIDDTKNTVDSFSYLGDDSTVSTSTNLPFCYFSLPEKTANMDWDTLKAEYWEEFLQIYVNYKKTNLNFTLKLPFVHAFNHFKLWYISKYSAYFFPMKISNFKSGSVTQVELIRV